MRLVHRIPAIVVSLSLLAGCTEAGDEPQVDEQPGTPNVETAQAAGPDTTAVSLWQHLENESYRDEWQLWPGKDRLYAGTEPHGMLLTTYVNSIAFQALQAGQVSDLPAGSIIVKENWMPDSTFAAATVMYKVEGYDAEHQDWLFAKYDAQGTPETFGHSAMCQACHQSAPSGYIYTAVQ